MRFVARNHHDQLSDQLRLSFEIGVIREVGSGRRRIPQGPSSDLNILLCAIGSLLKTGFLFLGVDFLRMKKYFYKRFFSDE